MGYLGFVLTEKLDSNAPLRICLCLLKVSLVYESKYSFTQGQAGHPPPRNGNFSRIIKGRPRQVMSA